MAMRLARLLCWTLLVFLVLPSARAHSLPFGSQSPPGTATSLGDAASATDPASSGALLHIYRPGKYVGGMSKMNITVDGLPVARLANGRHFSVQVPAGDHIISTKYSSGVQMKVQSGYQYYVRVEAKLVVVAIELVTPERGRQESAKTKVIDNDQLYVADLGRARVLSEQMGTPITGAAKTAAPASSPSPERSVAAQTGAETATVRFPVVHMHLNSFCYGWLHFGQDRVRYVMVWSDKAGDQHSFEAARAEIELKNPDAGTSARLDLSVRGERKVLFPVATKHVEDRVSFKYGKDTFMERRYVVEALNDFPAVLARFRARREGPTGTPRSPAPRPEGLPQGLYGVESELSFNVLDKVYLDQTTGQLSLAGHYDKRYAGPRIPYLQHLATLLEHPAPRFSLEWTAASKPRVDALYRRMDDPQELRALARQWAQVFDSSGKVTKYGRWLLPMWGIEPTPGNRPLGRIGAQVEAGTNGMTVREVLPGSAAARAGLKVGDEIINFNGVQHVVLSEFIRSVRQAGGGNTVKVMVLRYDGGAGGPPPKEVTLDAAEGDPWSELDRHDLLAQLLRAVGKPDAAKMVEALGTVARVFSTASREQQQTMLYRIESAFKVGELSQTLIERGRRGEINEQQFKYQMFRQMCVNMDEAFGFQDRPATSRFEEAAGRGALNDALGLAGAVVEERLIPVMSAALNTLWSRRQEYVSVPPAMIADSVGTTLEVVPQFIGVDGNSQLARVLYESDYLAKQLLNTPAIKELIPRYKTQFQFEREHPQYSSARQISQGHLWISIAGVEAVQSSSGNTLEVGNARMRFNVRETVDGRDLSPQPGSYEEFLTSLYDDFAAQYPVFHELREAAKVAAAASWMRRRGSRLRLPAGGRSSWSAPAVAPGFVFLSWTMNPTAGSVNATMLAAGGVSLVLQGLEPFPDGRVAGDFSVASDAAVVDLSQSSMIAPPTIPAVPGTGPGPTTAGPATPPAPTSTRPQLTKDIPVPRPLGWVGRATRAGKEMRRVEQALSVASADLGEWPDTQGRDKLRACRQKVIDVSLAERALNDLAGQNVARQADLERTRQMLEERRHDATELARECATDLSAGAAKSLNQWALQSSLDANDLSREQKGWAKLQSDLQNLRIELVNYEKTLVGGDPTQESDALARLSDAFKTAVSSAGETGLRGLFASPRWAAVLDSGNMALERADLALKALRLANLYVGFATGSTTIQRATSRAEDEAHALARLKPKYEEKVKAMEECLADPDVRQLLAESRAGPPVAPRPALAERLVTAEAPASTSASATRTGQPVQIGAAGAVAGAVFRVTADGRRIALSSGSPIYLHDRILSDARGRLQVMLTDETVFTLGPNADMVLDEFVYDPNESVQRITWRMTSGSFRWVTGKIKPKDPEDLKLKLPKVSIGGIRGTDFEVVFDPVAGGYVKVFEGEVTVREDASQRAVTLQTGEMALVSPEFRVGKPIRHSSDRRRYGGRGLFVANECGHAARRGLKCPHSRPGPPA